MRTTVKFDPDVAAKLASVRKRRKRPLKEIVNEALRKGLDFLDAEPERLEPFVVKPFPNSKLLVDVTCIGQVLLDMDVQDFLEKQKKLPNDPR